MLLPKAVCKLRDIVARKVARNGLHGVLLERDADGTARAVAGDGHCLLVAEFQEGDHHGFPEINGLNVAPRPGFSAIISSGMLKTGEKQIPREKAAGAAAQYLAVDEHTANGSITCGTPNCVTTQPSVRGGYANWRGVVDKHQYVELSKDGAPTAMLRLLGGLGNDDYRADKCVSIGVDAKRLAALVAALMRFSDADDKGVGIELQIPLDNSKPIRLRADSNHDTFALIMPRKLSTVASAQPNSDSKGGQ